MHIETLTKRFKRPEKKQIVKTEVSMNGDRLIDAVSSYIAKGMRLVHLGNVEYGFLGAPGETDEVFFSITDLNLRRVHYFETSQGELLYMPRNLNDSPIEDLKRAATDAELALIVYTMRRSVLTRDKDQEETDDPALPVDLT